MNGQKAWLGVPSPAQLPSFAKMPSLLLQDATAKERNVLMKASLVVDKSVTLVLLDGRGQMLTLHYSCNAVTAGHVACKEGLGEVWDGGTHSIACRPALVVEDQFPWMCPACLWHLLRELWDCK